MTAIPRFQNPAPAVYRTAVSRCLIAGIFASSQAFAALSLPPSLTTDVQPFASAPPATDWSTASIAGVAGTSTTVSAVDIAVQALTASGITTALPTQAATAANALAQHSSTGTSFIYTAPTGNNATALMSTLQNDSGGPVAAISISYAYTRIGSAVEESIGHRAFYSLTGLANSWTLIPGLSNIATTQTLTATATLSTPWATGAKLINGALESMTVPNLIPTPAPVPQSNSIQHFGIATAINSTGAKAGFFQGTMDEIRVWNLARSAAEIDAGKNIEIATGSGLIGHYGLNDATGTSASNSIGDPTGTLSNGPLWVDGSPFALNLPPTVVLTAPADSATAIGASTNLQLTITDPEASAQTVTYYGRRTTPATPGADFTIATLPDTQFYSENLNNNGRAATFLAQTQWLVDNRNSLNLAFVSHMGDIVQNGDAVPAEWLVADTAMKKIESQLDTLRAYGIPWGAAPGNHDQTGIAGAGGVNALYNQYFPASRYAGRNYWGGSHSPTNNHNNYQLFSTSGLDFIIIHLEYDTRAKSSYQTVLDWADALMKAYPDRRAIVTSHWIVNIGNPATFSSQGQNFHDDLKDNPNFFMMLCGHVHGEGRRTDTFEGRTVHSVLQDYQGRTNGGDGWLRYFVFSPSGNTITAKTYRVSNPVNPAAGSFETDADSEFTLSYNMQTPVTAWIPLGTVNIPAAGTSASLAWTGLEAGKDYEWYATVNDSVNTVTTATRRFSTAVNMPPTVSITAPMNNASLVAPASLTLTANAADGGGSITRVEFYQGDTKLGEDTSAPYEQAVSGLVAGSYTFSAVAVDNSAAATLSAAVNLTVAAGSWSYSQNFDGLGPTGTSLTALAGWSAGYFNPNVQQLTTGGNGLVTVISALTVDNGGAGTTTPALINIGTTGAPDRALGSFARTSPAGDQFMQVAITNDSGSPITSFVLSYKGEEWRNSTPPVQQLTMWFSNTNATSGFTAMPAFTFNSPNNTGGNTAIDGNAVGNFTQITGTYVPASPIAAGSTFYLRWYDINDNGISDDYLAIDDLSITLPIGQPPTTTLTAPANGTVHYVGGTINLTATASDSDGTIAKVEFYQGTTKLGEDSGAPYTYDWSGYAVGSYSLTAKAIDNNGNITTSTAAAINVYATTGSGTLTRGPYLNSGSHNQIVVRWRSSQSVVGRVRYGTSSTNLNQTVDETTAKTDHEVKLTGLVPYTRYYYSVGSAFDTLTPQVAENTSYTPGAPAPTAADYTFRTSPTPGTAVNTRIWIVGDCGRGTQVQANGRDAYYSYNGSASFTGTRIPDLNLQMGDNAYTSGTDAEYTTGYYNMYANIFRKMPQWSCLGNHDANNGSTSTTANFPYFDMFTFPTAGECGGAASGTERYYSFNYGNIHFICLDSQASLTTVDNPATTGVNEDGPMAIWLRSDLAANTATWTIAFWHHPPYSKGSHNSDTEGQMINMRTNFNPIMEAGGVDLLYFGHSHNYERSFLLDNSTKFNSGNGSVSGFTTAGSGKIRNAANGFAATATVNGTLLPGDGAYIKPLTGPRDHFGAVYNTAGMSGLADTGAIDHPVMHISYNSVGTVNLDIDGNTLTSTFVQSGGARPDNFTITKQGAADTDHDGIPDEYEIANGLNRYVNDSGINDKDGDGTTNMSEFIFGQSANVPDQYGWTTTTDPLTGNVTVTFPTLVGRTYRVLYSQTLLGWLDGSGVVTGDGTTKSWTDDGTTTGSAPAVTQERFYRVTASTVDP